MKSILTSKTMSCIEDIFGSMLNNSKKRLLIVKNNKNYICHLIKKNNDDISFSCKEYKEKIKEFKNLEILLIDDVDNITYNTQGSITRKS